MKFNLLESEVKKIIELTYLGLYVLTNVKADKNWTEYESLSRKFIKYYIKNTKKMKMRLQGVKKKIAAKEFHAKVGECMDEIYESVYETVEMLEKGALAFSLSQALADLAYPDKEDGDNLLKNVLTQEFYEEAINKLGAGIIRLEIPNGEERLKKLLTEAQEENSGVV